MPRQPRYLEIAEDLRSQIESGGISRNSQLPTENDLIEDYKASRNTIREAIRRLAGEGLVESRAGSGTFVTPEIVPFVTVLSTDPELGDDSADPESAAYINEVHSAHKTAKVDEPKVGLPVPPEKILNRLRLPAGTQVVSRRQNRYLEGIPWSTQTSYYPREFVNRGASRLLDAHDIKGGTVRYLGEALGVKQKGYRDWITARRPDSSEQDFFKIAHDAMVFELFRIGFDEQQVPMRATVTVFPTDRNQFIVNRGQVPDPFYGIEEDPSAVEEEDSS